MNSKKYGNIGEAKVLAKFVELGIPVYVPFGDNEKADLIAEFNNKLNKIQVKTSVSTKDGAMTFSLVSSTIHRKNGEVHIYNDKEIDYFALYNVEKDKIFLINIKDAPKRAVTIRCNKTKNGQHKDIRREEDYIIEKVLNMAD